jgi:hypothetical protein
MTPRQMTVTVGPQTTVTPGRGAASTPDVKKGVATASFQGPAVFTLPIVLPKTGRIEACALTLAANAKATVQIGGKKLAAAAPGKAKKVTLDAKAFGSGKDYVIEEVPFADFATYELKVTVAAPKTKNATLKLAAELDYLIPVESASDYLNYIMTQA